MTELERVLQEISECNYDISTITSQKSTLEDVVAGKQVELKAVEQEVALLQGEIIKLNRTLRELEVIKNWLSQGGNAE